MRLIDVDALEERYDKALKELNQTERKGMMLARWYLEDAPTVEERPHGEWISKGAGVWCSQCGSSELWPTDFCPNCGADMRGDRQCKDTAEL